MANKVIMNTKKIITFPNAGIESIRAETIIFNPLIVVMLRNGLKILKVLIALILLCPGKNYIILLKQKITMSIIIKIRLLYLDITTTKSSIFHGFRR